MSTARPSSFTAWRYIYRPGSCTIENTASPNAAGVMVAHYTGGEPAETYLERLNKALPCGSALFALFTWEEVCPQVAAAEDSEHGGPWTETTAEEFREMLNVLPPEAWNTTAGVEMFRLSEYQTSNLTRHFARAGGRYFTAIRRTSRPRSALVEEVRAALATPNA